jgi:uncharacterized protein YeaO (DUF488 family)
MIRIKHITDPADPSDGLRFLVDGASPQDARSESMQLAAWLRDVAPSDALRRWFGYDPSRWDEFQRRYARELDRNADGLCVLLEAACRRDVTLLYEAGDDQLNHATILKTYLQRFLPDWQVPWNSSAAEMTTILYGAHAAE